MSYCDFAQFYDLLTENIDYGALADYYAELLHGCGVKKGGSVLELACGTGGLTVPLSKKGFNMTAADISQDMLSIAAGKISTVQWLCCDMTRLPFQLQFDGIVCALDSFNHLESTQSMQAAFDCAYSALKFGGVLAADMNTPFKHRSILADNAFTFDYDGLFCVWQNELDKTHPLLKVDMFLDFFSENPDGSYTRYSDFHSEIAPAAEQVTEMLKKSGFESIDIFAYPTKKALNEQDEKFTVTATK